RGTGRPPGIPPRPSVVELDVEVGALVVVDDAGGSGPSGEAAGTGRRDDVPEPRIRIGLEPTVLDGHRALTTVIGASLDPLRRHIGTRTLLGARGGEQGGGLPDDPRHEGLG